MSLNRIAASTPWRRTGCRVISATRSGRRQDSSIPMPSRQLAVLRQRATGLPHEPHRRVRHRLAPAGAQERGVPQGVIVIAGHGGNTSMARQTGPVGGRCHRSWHEHCSTWAPRHSTLRPGRRGPGDLRSPDAPWATASARAAPPSCRSRPRRATSTAPTAPSWRCVICGWALIGAFEVAARPGSRLAGRAGRARLTLRRVRLGQPSPVSRCRQPAPISTTPAARR